MWIRSPPRPALRPFVETVWVSDDREAPAAAVRERVLPTGAMHLVFRLDQPLRLFEGTEDARGRVVGFEVVGGARADFYERDVSTPARSVGAQLRPGAAALLLGAGADELAGRHTPLAELWGRSAAEARARLAEAPGAAQRLELFESLLEARLPRVRGLHPAVALALARFAGGADVGAVVREVGLSHRHFIALFRRAVGLTPQLHCRVRRFQEVLRAAEAGWRAPWAELALRAGYSDQAHLQREFKEFSGLSPGAHRRLAPDGSRHVPLWDYAQVNSIQDALRTRRHPGSTPSEEEDS